MSCVLWSVSSSLSSVLHENECHISLQLFTLFVSFRRVNRVSSVLIHLLSGLLVSQQFGKHCHLQVNLGTAAYEIPNWAQLWYRTVWNIIDTGVFPVPVYRASLFDTIDNVIACHIFTSSTWTDDRCFNSRPNPKSYRYVTLQKAVQVKTYECSHVSHCSSQICSGVCHVTLQRHRSSIPHHRDMSPNKQSAVGNEAFIQFDWLESAMHTPVRHKDLSEDLTSPLKSARRRQNKALWKASVIKNNETKQNKSD